MPHYKDGTEARIGDQVTGKLYNSPGIRSGTIISITPGADSCNAQVAFMEPVLIDGDPADHWRDLESGWVDGDPLHAKVPRMAVWRDKGGLHSPRFRVIQGQNHGSNGPAFALFECVDYCGVSELTRVGP